MNNQTCIAKFKNQTEEFRSSAVLYCPTVFDTFLCWGPTLANTSISQNCPVQRGVDPTKFAWRTCTAEGKWSNNGKEELIDQGYTNYTTCITNLAHGVHDMCQRLGEGACDTIVYATRKIEMVGLSLSLIALIASLVIFYRYRVLRNNRTTIHKNLFIATLNQVIIRLIIYSDQKYKLIENKPYLCEMCYILLEFSKTATIMWMFIEGLSLHNAMTVAVFQEYSFIKIYCYAGWLASILLTSIWAMSMVYTETGICWYMYNFQSNYWILEGPTSALIVINMLFLLNIIRIVVMKLRNSNMGEFEQMRKAVRAAILLVPLMGTLNVLFMIDYRIFTSAWMFGLWAFSTYFFTSFQGFFIANLYCFMNGEVRDVVKNNFSLYMSLRTGGVGGAHLHQRNSSEVTRLSSLDPEV